MADLNSIQPYLLGAIAAAVGWLFKAEIQTGKDIVALQTTVRYYLESSTKGAAKLLDSPNPTPPEMRVLLRRYYEGNATETEKIELKQWLRDLIEDEKSPKSERSAAIDMLSGMESLPLLPKPRWYSRLWH